MKILFYGDSITDASRNRENDHILASYGFGYVSFVAGELLSKAPEDYQILNRGISGNRIVDLYARVKADVWNHEPDLLSILIGVNDIWHEIAHQNGVDIVRYEKMYRTLLEDTKERLPNVKLLLIEPFVLLGRATEEAYERFCEVKEYAKVVKKLAEEYGAYYLPLQEKLDELAAQHSPTDYLADGVHPSVAGAKVIADEWLKLFKEKIQ